MKLATLKMANARCVVGVDDTTPQMRYADLTAIDSNLPGCLKTLLASEEGLKSAQSAYETAMEKSQFVDGELLAPIPNPGKVICIGLNYRDHAEETGAEIPTEPVCFSKFPSAVIGPGEAIVLPKVSQQVDYEAELVVVIGKRMKNATRENARMCIAGYMNGNDVSARDWQKGRPGGQWLLGKTPDTFAPTGPFLVTAEEIPEPETLSVRLRLNGETMQDGSTRELIFGIDELIVYLSQLVTLEPGDLIFTGTPPGVGMARKPPVFLKDGDRTEVEIEGLGVLANPIRQES